MIIFIICSGIITVFAILLCLFSGRQQRKEDEYLVSRPKNSEELEAMRRERADWDLLNHWDDE